MTRSLATYWRAAVLCLSLFSLAAPAARADEVYLIPGEMWDLYQDYLDKIGQGRRPGAFAITRDGLGAYYTWCDGQRCRIGSSYSNEAKTKCENHYEMECVVFAVRDEIKVKYEIVPVGGSQ